MLQDFFSIVLVLPCFLAGVFVLVGKPEAAVISNINQMEYLEGEQDYQYLISAKKVLFWALFKIGFECFLRTNHIN